MCVRVYISERKKVKHITSRYIYTKREGWVQMSSNYIITDIQDAQNECV